MKPTIAALALSALFASGAVPEPPCEDGISQAGLPELFVNLDRIQKAVLPSGRQLLQIAEVEGDLGAIIEVPEGLVFKTPSGKTYTVSLQQAFPQVTAAIGKQLTAPDACRQLLAVTQTDAGGDGVIASVRGTLGAGPTAVNDALVELIRHTDTSGDGIYHEKVFGYAPMSLRIHEGGTLIADVKIADAWPCALLLLDVPDTKAGAEIALVWMSAGRSYTTGVTIFAIRPTGP